MDITIVPRARTYCCSASDNAPAALPCGYLNITVEVPASTYNDMLDILRQSIGVLVRPAPTPPGLSTTTSLAKIEEDELVTVSSWVAVVDTLAQKQRIGPCPSFVGSSNIDTATYLCRVSVAVGGLGGPNVDDEEGGGTVQSLTMEGTISEINGALSSMLYLPQRDWSGADSVVIVISTAQSDITQMSGTAAVNISSTISINVSPVNDVPEFIWNGLPLAAAVQNGPLDTNATEVPVISAINAAEGSILLIFSGLTVSDVDSTYLSGSISATAGMVGVDATSQGQSLVINATASDLSNALDSLSLFLPSTRDPSDPVLVTLSIYDGVGSSSISVLVYVVPATTIAIEMSEIDVSTPDSSPTDTVVNQIDSVFDTGMVGVAAMEDPTGLDMTFPGATGDLGPWRIHAPLSVSTTYNQIGQNFSAPMPTMNVTWSPSFSVCNEDSASCPLPLLMLASLNTTSTTLCLNITVRHGRLHLPGSFGSTNNRLAVMHANATFVALLASDASSMGDFVNGMYYSPSANFNGVWPGSGMQEKMILDPSSELELVVASASSSCWVVVDDTVAASMTMSVSTNPTLDVKPALYFILHSPLSFHPLYVYVLFQVSWENDAPTISGVDTSVIDVSDSYTAILEDITIYDADLIDIVSGTVNGTLRVVAAVSCDALSGGLLMLPMTTLLQSGVEFDQSAVSEQNRTIQLTGDIHAVESALRQVLFYGGSMTTTTATVVLTVSDQGNYGKGGSRSASIQLTLALTAINSRGYSLSWSGSDTGSIVTANKSLVAPIDSIILRKSPFFATDYAQAIVSTSGLANIGQIASSSVYAGAARKDLSKTFQLDISGHSQAAAEIQTLTVDVPWRYARQALQLFTYLGNSSRQGSPVSADQNVDLTVSLTYFNRSDSASFSASAPLTDLATRLQEALATMPSAGVVSVDHLWPNASSPAGLYGTLYVTFLTSSGDVPLLNVTSSYNNMTVKVTKIEKGSLTPETQQVRITAASSINQGAFILVFPLKPGVSVDRQFVESSPIALNSTASQIQVLLSNVPGIGLVSVQGSAFNGTFASFRLTFLTYGTKLDPIIVVSSLGSTDTARYLTRQSCPSYLCTPFPSAANLSIVMSVSEIVAGTTPIDGSMKLGLSLTSSGVMGPSITTAAFSPFVSGPVLATLLRRLPGVVDAEVWKSECSPEFRCSWFLTIWHKSGRIPLLSPVVDQLRGTGERHP